MSDIETRHVVRVWHGDQCVAKDLDHAALVEALGDPHSLVWLDLVAPSPEALAELGRDLDLGATALEDAIAPFERPKVTRHDSHIFFTTVATWLEGGDAVSTADRGRLRLARVSGFVLPHALITVRLDDSFDLGPVLRSFEENARLLPAGPIALVHGLLDVVVDGHFETIQQLDDDVEALEDELFEERARNHAFLRSVYGLRKDLVALRRVVLPMRELVNGLLRHHRDGDAPARSGNERVDAARRELASWFDDLYDHVLRASEWTESLRDMITSLFETNLSLQDSRLNEVMKKLAAWAAVIAVPTAITGWFGQNVPYPGFSTMVGLWESVVLVVVLPVVLWFVFRRAGWL